MQVRGRRACVMGLEIPLPRPGQSLRLDSEGNRVTVLFLSPLIACLDKVAENQKNDRLGAVRGRKGENRG